MNNEAFEKIVLEFGPSVYRAALSKTGDVHTAQDVFQQVFLLLCEKRPTFACREQLKVWLIRSSYKLAAAERRKFDNTKTVPLETAVPLQSHDSLTFEFYELVLSLPETLRDVTVLFYIEDMSIKDISKTLSLSVSAVKARLTRARAHLEKIYKEEIL